MKVIGHNGTSNGRGISSVIVQATTDEWDSLRQLAGVPYDKASTDVGTEYDARKAESILDAYKGLKQLRKEMIELSKKWNKFLEGMDAVLGTTKPE